jgi:hypothetical protein
MKSFFTTLLFTCFLSLSLNAISIDSLRIIPTAPTNVDTVKVIAFTLLPNTPCNQLASSVEIIDNTIFVHSYHVMGGMNITCNSTDTIVLGVFNPGNYELHYHLINDYYQHTWDIDTILFTVVEPVGIRRIANQNSNPLVYPIPTGNIVTIHLPPSGDGYHIKLYSQLGREIKTVYTEKEVVTINLSAAPQGILYAVITDKFGRRWTKKIIKSAH